MSLSFHEATRVICEEVQNLLATVDPEKVLSFIHMLHPEGSKRRFFFWARGRSFLILRGFAMRLMHLGHEVHIVGEVDCPSIVPGDILVVASGSGSTGSVLLFAEKARKYGAEVVAILGRDTSPLHQIASYTIEFHPERAGQTVQLSASAGSGGTRFEHSLMIFCDACILSLVYDWKEKAYHDMMERHANLE